MTEPEPLVALVDIVRELTERGRQFALVGGLAVSIRAEVRFTRDVDIAVAVNDDADAESLIFELKQSGYMPIVTVEHELRARLSTVRLLSTVGIKVDLLFASCGIEPEIVQRATSVELKDSTRMPVASSEELIAMKILSMTEQRLQDRMDVQRLIQFGVDLDMDRVRNNLALITERGYHRDQDLLSKLNLVLNQLA
jgi:predicted nucleotidyltransferase